MLRFSFQLLIQLAPTILFTIDIEMVIFVETSCILPAVIYSVLWKVARRPAEDAVSATQRRAGGSSHADRTDEK